MVSPNSNSIRALREHRGWTQAQLAEHAQVSRTAVSAIEQGQMSPSVDAAIRLARALGSRVEDVFTPPASQSPPPREWAWQPPSPHTRYWQASIGGQIIDYPVEMTAQGMLPHDGISGPNPATTPSDQGDDAGRTLVIACCDPAVAVLLSLYARRSGFRPLCFQRTSGEALDLLRRGLVHVAGVHLARAGDPGGNAQAAAGVLGPGHSLLHMLQWESGISVTKGGGTSVRAAVQPNVRWIGRPAGSGARVCQEEVLGPRTPPRRTAASHQEVVQALKGGWADAGICLRLVSEQAGIPFVPVRRESYDLCMRDSDLADPRLTALVDAVRSRHYRTQVGGLPGYQLSPGTGDLEPIGSSTNGSQPCAI
jgi:molybdate-binding protein/DNA-binding XRE family transcriptional regulator